MSKYKKKRNKYLKKWREANKEHVAAYTEARNNDPKWQEYVRSWSKNKKALANNPEALRKFKAKKRQWRKMRNRHNVIANKIRSQISRTVKGSLVKNLPELLGCSIPEFKAHIEKQFHSGMTWENYGKAWQVDHIIPCKKFDCNKIEDQKACFHYSNTQPLLGFENQKKGAKILSPLQMKIAI